MKINRILEKEDYAREMEEQDIKLNKEWEEKHAKFMKEREEELDMIKKRLS